MRESSHKSAMAGLVVATLIATGLWYYGQIASGEFFVNFLDKLFIGIANDARGASVRIEVWDHVFSFQPLKHFGFGPASAAIRPVWRVFSVGDDGLLSNLRLGVRAERVQEPQLTTGIYSTSRYRAGYVVVFPHAMLILPLAVAIRALVQHIGHSKPTEGTCGNCGYDVRANKDQCSECGALLAETDDRHYRDIQRPQVRWRSVLPTAMLLLAASALCSVLSFFAPTAHSLSLVVGVVRLFAPMEKDAGMASGPSPDLVSWLLYGFSLFATVCFWSYAMAATHVAAKEIVLFQRKKLFVSNALPGIRKFKGGRSL